MKVPLIVLLEAVTLTLALSLDVFLVSFAYGSNKIKIPTLSMQIINIVCSSILGFSLLMGNIFKRYLPSRLIILALFVFIFFLAATKLLENTMRPFIDRHLISNGEAEHPLPALLSSYASPVNADSNSDYLRLITPSEATILALALSLDSLVVGFGAAIGNVNTGLVFLCSLIIGMFAILSGNYAGNKIAREIPFDISWLSSVMLISLALLKILNLY